MFVFFKKMDQIEHCPQTGKIYVLIVVCLVFSCLLISINSLTRNSADDNLFGTGIAVAVIQIIFTLYLIGIDLFGNCRGFTTNPTKTKCVDGCKWSIFAPKIYKCTNQDIVTAYIYIPIILLSSAYMLGFGITDLKNSTDTNDEQAITTLSIASTITGAVGLLYIFSDVICSVSCKWL